MRKEELAPYLTPDTKPLLALAPMAGVSDKALRLLAKDYQCDLLFSEMVSAKALTFNNEKTKMLLNTEGEKGPIAIQLFGSEADVVAKGAEKAVMLGAEWLDFNMGCPVPKVAGNGEGSGLLREPDKALAIIKKLVENVDVPVSVKIRIGWDVYVPEETRYLVQGLENAGINLLTVHGRTRSAYYTGQADWQAIADVVEQVNIPVLANGDVDSPEKAREILQQTGATGIMIGRGAMGAPWLFADIKHYFATGESAAVHDIQERIAVIKRHASLLTVDKGEYIAMREMRKHLGWYVKGLRYAASLRREACQISSLEDLNILLDSWEKQLQFCE